MTGAITRDQAIAGLEAVVVDEDHEKNRAVRAAEREHVEINGRRAFFRLRSKWSWWIVIWISSLIIFNASLTYMVGANHLDFKEYQWFITAVTVETFLQIVGMGYIAVKFLFSNG